MKQTLLVVWLSIIPLFLFGQFGEEQIITACEICTPVDILSEDLDGDGDLDVIIAAEFDGKISWFENLGDGNFSKDFKVIGIARGAVQVEGKDIDSDGDIDIISTSPKDRTLFWFKNNGLGEFSEKILIAKEEDILRYISIDDLNKDGNEDIIVAPRSGKVVWYANLGNGLFSEANFIISEPILTNTIKSGDIDNDGHIDVVISYFGDKLIWMKNEGDGTFLSTIIIENENEIDEELIFSVVDQDKDGLLDIVGLDAGRNSLFWYKNEEVGNFSPARIIASDFERATGILSTDIDADGDNDIVAGSRSRYEEELVWFENLGGENFSSGNILHERALDAKSIVSSDLDNDGNLDILTIFADRSEVVWFQNLQNGEFSAANTIFNIPSGTVSIQNADIDLDGIQDVLTTFTNDDEIAWYKLDGNGQFTTPNIISNSFIAPVFVFPADLDGDNDFDVVAASIKTNEIVWFENIGEGEFSSQNSLSITFEVISNLEAVDIDNDGDFDIVFNNFGFGIFWMENDGNANFSDPQAISFNGLDGSTFVIADLNNDNYLDLVSFSPSRVVWFENEGNGNFSSQRFIAAPEGYSINSKAADLDGDGDMDLLHCSINGGLLFWYENDGNGNFGEANLISDIVRLVRDFETEDIDNDGDIDIFIAGNHSRKIYWFENYGAGDFSSPLLISRNFDFFGTVHLMDLDSDNDLDLIYSSVEDDKISWFENLFELPQISGKVFWDDNENKVCDNEEAGLNNLPVTIEPSNIISSYSDLNGNFHFFVDKGLEYKVAVEIDSCWTLTTDSTTLSIIVGEENIIDTDFGYALSSNYKNTDVAINTSPTRCGFEVGVWLSIENVGCEPVAGQYAVVLDSLTEFIRSEIEPVDRRGDTVFWNYASLISRDIEKNYFVLQMPGPEFIGEIIRLRALSYTENNQGALEISSTYDYDSEIRCAYDPNDKLVQPNRSFDYDQNYTLFEETFEYTVRFQNTGNDTAFNVVIRDNLDKNLDWTTFKPIVSSHPFETLLHKDGLVEFSFKNILLPDSTTNEPLSHGFISYKIAPKNGLAENTLIENTANIFFDFNPPIVTNTIQSIMVSELPKTTSVKDLIQNEAIRVYPNPFTNQLNFEFENWKYQTPPLIKLFDIHGKLLQENRVDKSNYQMSLPTMSNGLYFYQIIKEDGVLISSGKVLKQDIGF